LNVLTCRVIAVLFQVFQRRQDGSVEFYRYWTNYQNGFGDPAGEFWLGWRNNFYFCYFLFKFI